MNCPKCKGRLSEKKKYNAPCLCEQCGGMWIQTKQLRNLSALPDELETPLSDQENYDRQTGMCPEGHGIMLRSKVDVDDPFYLEKCTACGGIWFDNGEWQRVSRTAFAENLENLWCRSWQRRQREKKNRDAFLEMNRDLLGEDIFQRIVELSGLLRNHPESTRAVALLQQEISET